MRERKMLGRVATTFAAGFFVTALMTSILGSMMAFGAPNFTQLIIDTVNAGLSAIGIRVASAVGLEALLSLAGGVSALLLTNRRRPA